MYSTTTTTAPEAEPTEAEQLRAALEDANCDREGLRRQVAALADTALSARWWGVLDAADIIDCHLASSRVRSPVARRHLQAMVTTLRSTATETIRGRPTRRETPDLHDLRLLLLEAAAWVVRVLHPSPGESHTDARAAGAELEQRIRAAVEASRREGA